MQKADLPIIIAGPTASGKTDLALALAHMSDGIIISADSRQVYKGLNAGTAAPEGVWDNGVYKAQGIPYRMVDFLDINESFDVSKFRAAAEEIEASAQGRQIIFAGGTGMYLQGRFSGMDELPPADAALRAELKKHDKQTLYNMLAGRDALSAAQIPPGNVQRVMRALEISLLSGRPASELRTGKFNPGITPDKAKFFYLHCDKEVLNERIARRTAQIFGPMKAEAARALQAGYSPDAPGLKSLGYREAIACLNGQISQEAAIERITILTRQYAKRQRTWFGRYKDMIRIDLRGNVDPQETAQKIFGCKKRQ
jgi:tRNA dimethylallyltransferase